MLPANLDELIVENLRAADAAVDFLFRRYPEGVGVVLRGDGDFEVVRSV